MTLAVLQNRPQLVLCGWPVFKLFHRRKKLVLAEWVRGEFVVKTSNLKENFRSGALKLLMHISSERSSIYIFSFLRKIPIFLQT